MTYNFMTNHSPSEEEIIHCFSTLFSQAPTGDLIMGIGDDAAVLKKNDQKYWIVTTDQMVENIHFKKKWSSASMVATKLITANLSDCYVKGGRPQFMLLNLALPKSYSSQWIEEFSSRIKELADQYAFRLIGGDTTGSPDSLFVNATFLAEASVAKTFPSLEEGAVLYLTHPVGSAAAGLRCLEECLHPKEHTTLVERQLCPSIYPAVPLFLAESEYVDYVTDLSDGLYAGLKKIIGQDRCAPSGASIHLDQIPVQEELARLCEETGWELEEFKLMGGEDFAPLAVVKPDLVPPFEQEFMKKFSYLPFQIGNLQGTEMHFYSKGKIYKTKGLPYRHF